MHVLVDTNIWSLSLRRAGSQLSEVESAIAGKLGEIIGEGRLKIIGPIRQELLSGIRQAEHFEKIRRQLRAFPDELLTVDDFEQAAQWHNLCRSKGISGSHTDFLICAVARHRNWQVFTTDRDFDTYASVLKLHRFDPR